MGIGVCFASFLASLSAYAYVMARYEEFMTNKDIFDLVVGRPARAAWGFGMKCLDFAAGFVWGPFELLFGTEPGCSGKYGEDDDAFNRGRLAFQIVTCVGLCILTIGTGLGTIGYTLSAIQRFLWPA